MTVAPGRLFASILLTAAGLVLELMIVTLVVLAIVAPAAATAVISVGAFTLFGLAVSFFRRFNGDYRLTLTHTPDGLHLRSGLVETSGGDDPAGTDPGHPDDRAARLAAVGMVPPGSRCREPEIQGPPGS